MFWFRCIFARVCSCARWASSLPTLWFVASLAFSEVNIAVCGLQFMPPPACVYNTNEGDCLGSMRLCAWCRRSATCLSLPCQSDGLNLTVADCPGALFSNGSGSGLTFRALARASSKSWSSVRRRSSFCSGSSSVSWASSLTASWCRALGSCPKSAAAVARGITACAAA